VHKNRVRVAVVYGGRSGEHEVSIHSARSVINAIDPDQYEVVPIGITHEGAWMLAEPDALLNGTVSPESHVLPSAEPGQRTLVPSADASSIVRSVQDVEVIFPLVHGTYGEDGCLQGLFDLANLPYVGSNVLASAVGMDKIIMKRVFQAEGLPVVPYVALRRSDWERDPARVQARVERELGFPCFVKPSNLGSSVGISKVGSSAELPDALDFAARYSERLVVERGISARELECGVLGNDEPAASVVGEVRPAREFYDYAAKYRDEETQFDIPAQVDEATTRRIQELAIQAFQVVGASGMARVDFFMDRADGEIYLNEINTIPGFTSMSVYPQLWAASGLGYRDLIGRLIELARERHRDHLRNETRFEL
jgi:D-alanine-D-alanine ligase